MSATRLRVRSIPRRKLPGDGSVESFLTVSVGRAFEAGKPVGLSAVVVRPAQLELVDVAAGGPIPLPNLLAGLTTTVTQAGEVEIVGLVGQLKVQSSTPHLVAVVFLEWPDCRWWMWECVVGDGGLKLETVRERDAREGDALPAGVGRYWSLARRSRATMSLSLVPGPEQVH